jgi:hypothetical protein
MPVIGINITKVESERKKPLDAPLEVKSNTKIKKVMDLDMPAFNRKGLAILFEFGVDYLKDGKESYGEIKLSGEVIYIDPNQDKLVEEWKKTNKLPQAINVEIINAILRKCILKALSYSDELGLPPPIALPFASPKPEEKQEKKE